MHTTNATTQKKAVNLRARIGKEFTEILALIQLNTTGSLTNAEKKLKFIVKLIERFIEDEKDNLFSLDVEALTDLQAEVVGLISARESMSNDEFLEKAAFLQRKAAIILN